MTGARRKLERTVDAQGIKQFDPGQSQMPQQDNGRGEAMGEKSACLFAKCEAEARQISPQHKSVPPRLTPALSEMGSFGVREPTGYDASFRAASHVPPASTQTRLSGRGRCFQFKPPKHRQDRQDGTPSNTKV